MKVIFFHDPDKEYGYMSNWYKVDFVAEDIKFSSTEQFMMYKKAMLFGDTEIANKILQVSDPDEAKQLGRKAGPFNQKLWDENKLGIMLQGVYAKFSQNPDLRDKLIATETAVLCEAARTDPVWSIEVGIYDDRRFDVRNWKGENLLGFALMAVRYELQVI